MQLGIINGPGWAERHLAQTKTRRLIKSPASMAGEKPDNPLMTGLAGLLYNMARYCNLWGESSLRNKRMEVIVCQSIKKGRLASTASSI